MARIFLQSESSHCGVEDVTAFILKSDGNERSDSILNFVPEVKMHCEGKTGVSIEGEGGHEC